MPRSLSSRRHKRFCELLAAYRARANLKQAEVAARLSRHQPFISDIESGQRRIDLIELLELAEVVGFDMHLLIDELIATPKE